MMTQIEMDRLNVVLKPVGSPASACEVTVYGDLRKGLRKNWVMDKWISGSAAVGGAASGTAVGVAALSLGALSVLTAAGGAAVLGGLTLLGYRALYRHALRKSQDEVTTLLAALESAIQAAKVFGSPPPPNAPPPSGRADDSLLIVA